MWSFDQDLTPSASEIHWLASSTRLPASATSIAAVASAATGAFRRRPVQAVRAPKPRPPLTGVATTSAAARPGWARAAFFASRRCRAACVPRECRDIRLTDSGGVPFDLTCGLAESDFVYRYTRSLGRPSSRPTRAHAHLLGRGPGLQVHQIVEAFPLLGRGPRPPPEGARSARTVRKALMMPVTAGNLCARIRPPGPGMTQSFSVPVRRTSACSAPEALRQALRCPGGGGHGAHCHGRQPATHCRQRVLHRR